MSEKQFLYIHLIHLFTLYQNQKDLGGKQGTTSPRQEASGS